MRRTAGWLAILTSVTVSAIGCGDAVGTVSGSVTIDGRPLDKGFISFVPADSAGAPITVDVKQGRYDLQTVAGNKRVQISAPVVVSSRPEYNGPGAPIVEISEESLPAKYNSESELTFEVKRGANAKDWQVTGAKLPQRQR
jgi:hypothetical protein